MGDGRYPLTAATGPHILADVLALTTLPNLWIGARTDALARTLADALFRLLDLDRLEVVIDNAETEVREVRHGDVIPGGHVLSTPIGTAPQRGKILSSSKRADFPDGRDRLLLNLAASQSEIALRDIALSNALSTMQLQLAHTEKLATLGQLVGGVAHEVRTPLTYTANHLHLATMLLEREPADIDRLRNHIATALKGLERISQLVVDLKPFTKTPQPTFSLASLDDVVEEAGRLFSATHPQCPPVETQLNPCPAVPMDRCQVQQIVLNLLQNAAEANGRHAAIRLATRPISDGVELSVTDQGKGIDEDTRMRMFEPFFTTKSDGLGLGLAVVRRIVENHRAKLRVDSTRGEGTRVTVTFPNAPNEPEAQRQHVPA